MPETHFDDWIAQRYEALWPELFDPLVVEPTVDFLAELAGDGAALEFGIGTGRIALPLSKRGYSRAWHRALTRHALSTAQPA